MENMMKNVKTILLAFSAGLMGAWAFQEFGPIDKFQQFETVESPIRPNYNVNYTSESAPNNNTPISFVDASEKSTPS